MPPLKYFVPNSFTAASLLIGLMSVMLSARGDFDLAAWAILWATLLDKLDGTAARLCKATSEFGVQFDSFADFVGFGIAPAALVYFKLQASGLYSGYELVPMAAAGLHVLALAVRLARFNITTGGERVFFGMPGTLMGALVATAYLTWSKYELADSLLLYSPAYLAIGAALMVSSLRLPKLTVRKSKAMNVFQFSNVLIAYVCGPLMLVPEYLFALGVLYAVGGFGWCLLNPPEQEPEQETQEPEQPLAA